MKKLIATLCLTAVVTGAYAQGVVKFSNSASTLVSVQQTLGGAVAVMASGTANAYYFSVFTAASGTTDPFAFQYSGTFATNSMTAPGRFVGGASTGIAVGNWAPGETKSYFVAGWNSALGHDFKPIWLQELLNKVPGDTGLFGISGIAIGAAGGPDPATGLSIPALSLFGASGINAGFTLTPIPVPEPTTLALAGLGAAALLIFRRRN